MRVRTRGGVTVAHDTPAMHWLLALLFLGVGALFVAGPLGLFADAERLRWWLRALTAAAGLAAVAVGIWTLARAPRSRVTIDGTRVRLERRGLGGRVVREWPREALASVQLVQRSDDEGGAVFQIHLWLRDEQPVPVSPVWRHGRAHMAEVARRLAEASGVRAINAAPITAPRAKGSTDHV